jgi:hypothetical protein
MLVSFVIAAVAQAQSLRLFKNYDARALVSGEDFQFMDMRDPTNGLVDYVSRDQAYKSGLVQVEGNSVFLRSRRKSDGVPESIRLESRTRFNGGLFLFDAEHIPTGCGTWPAFWTFGDNWPYGGEIE